MAKLFKGATDKLASIFKNVTITKCDECQMACESEVRFCKKCIRYLCEECFDSHEDHNFADGDDDEEESSSDNDDDGRPTCAFCMRSGQDNIPLAFCRDCNKDMCADCAENHRKKDDTRHHRVMNESISPPPAEQQKSADGSSRKKAKNNKKITPGKPKISKVKAETIWIEWRKPINITQKDFYRLSYNEGNSRSNWSIWKENIETNKTQLTGLKSKTKYTFRVKVIHRDDEWPNSKQSEVIETKESMGASLVKQSRRTKYGTPSVYSLPAQEDLNARNNTMKTKKYWLGTKREEYIRREKVIMLVGATGTGKTTLVDGIVNYILGVDWGDPFRFTIVELENSERNRIANQSESQTEWITCYTIYSTKDGGRLDFTLTIVDTPGFGDTRGLVYDKRTIDQIKHLFSQQGPKGILSLDAICFLNKAPDARLTAQQKYVFQQILSMFGKDVEGNICSLITFADGQEPPVLHSLRESKLPINKYFCFNNSALFAPNDTESFSKMFWNMGLESFQKFFSHVQKLQPKSLEMTRNVLHERETLENTIENIQQQVSSGLFTISTLREEIKIFRQHKTDAEANKDFEYDIKHQVVKTKSLPPGEHITNCLHCNHTCHHPCQLANDGDKKGCAAMDSTGDCTVCKYRCHWSQHKNTPHIIYTEIVNKKEKYSKKMEKFQDAKKGMVTHEEAIGMLKQEMIDKMLDVQDQMEIVKRCNERLKEMALRPNPLSMVKYIDIMIEAEDIERGPGYIERIKELKFYRKRATTDKTVEEFLANRLDDELNIH